jgi:hypothetical protein
MDFGLGITCGFVLGFAAATFIWICIHYLVEEAMTDRELLLSLRDQIERTSECA